MLHAQVLGACPCPCLRDQILTRSVVCSCTLPCACLCPMAFCPWRCVFRLSLAGGGQPFVSHDEDCYHALPVPEV
eukprot:6110115-Amphidinium_carterae.1